MDAWNDFVDRLASAGATAAVAGNRRVVLCYGDIDNEYQAAGSGLAIVDRSDRGLLEVTGKDRITWLQNLTTNQVKTLGGNEGNYAFALNVQGRILFDLNVIVRSDSVWIDLDRSFLPTAVAHFNKYIVMEDVHLSDRSDEWVRLAIVGKGTARFFDSLGASHLATAAALSISAVTWRDTILDALRHDFCGSLAAELFVPVPLAPAFWLEATGNASRARAIPVGDDAIQVRRIEAGLPWSGREITSESLPAETGQLERAVSFQKGCYLGQEVVERMRSRKVVARLLRGLLVEGNAIPLSGAEILDAENKGIGQVTSACRSFALGRVVALGYVKTASAAPGTEVTIVSSGATMQAVTADLPFVGASLH